MCVAEICSYLLAFRLLFSLEWSGEKDVFCKVLVLNLTKSRFAR